MTTITITTNDGKKFQIDRNVATLSPLINDLTGQNLGDGTEEGIPLPNVDGPTFERVIQYLEFHVDDIPKPTEEMQTGKDATDKDATDKDALKEELTEEAKKKIEEDKKKADEWDKEFCKMDEDPPTNVDCLFKTMFASLYLQVAPLNSLMFKAVNDQFLDKSEEEICQKFRVNRADFTPEEEAKVKAENQWAVEEGVDDPRTEEEKAQMRQENQQEATEAT